MQLQIIVKLNELDHKTSNGKKYNFSEYSLATVFKGIYARET